MQDNLETLLSWKSPSARLAQSAERKALNLVVVGSSPTVGVCYSCRRSVMTRTHNAPRSENGYAATALWKNAFYAKHPPWGSNPRPQG